MELGMANFVGQTAKYFKGQLIINDTQLEAKLSSS